MYVRPVLQDGDRVAVHQVSEYDFIGAVVIHHVCVGNGRMWSQRTTVHTPGEPDRDHFWSRPDDLTDLVRWDGAEGIFYIN